MAIKPSYEELEQRVKELEQKAVEEQKAEEALGENARQEDYLVLRFTNIVTYLNEKYLNKCSLHSARTFGRAARLELAENLADTSHVEGSWPRAALSPE